MQAHSIETHMHIAHCMCIDHHTSHHTRLFCCVALSAGAPRHAVFLVRVGVEGVRSIGRRFADVTTVADKAATQGFIASKVSVIVLQLLHLRQQCSHGVTAAVLLTSVSRTVTARTARTTQSMPVMPLATTIVNPESLASHSQQQQQVRPLAALISLLLASAQAMPMFLWAITVP
jgi:hypothetical protein